MSDQPTILQQSAALAAQHLGLSNQETAQIVSVSELDELRLKLTHLIQYLLDTDHPRLVQALYRIDVEESKLAQILSETPVNQTAAAIAELVLDREMQKVILRQRYKNK